MSQRSLIITGSTRRIGLAVARAIRVAGGSAMVTGRAQESVDDAWKLVPEDVAEVAMGLWRHPARSLPSRVEIRPSRPRKA